MSVILRWPGHVAHHCDTRTCDGCMFCHGGLFACVTCGGLEGSVPTDCPGERMPEVVADEVYAGAIDYRRGEGWTRRPSKLWEGIVRGGNT